MATNPFAQFVEQPETKENPFAKYATPALKLVPATPAAAAPAAQPAAPVTGVTPPVVVPQRADALAGPASRLPPSLTAPAVTPVTPPPPAAAPPAAPVLKPAPVVPTSTASSTAEGMAGYKPGQGSREDQSLIDQQDIYWDRSETGVVRYQPNPKFNAGMDEPGEVPLGKAKTREQALALVEAYKKKNPTAAPVTGVTPTPPAVPASGWPVGMNPKWEPDKKGSRTGPGRLEIYGKDAGRFNSSTEAFAEVAKQTLRIEQKASAPTVPTPAVIPEKAVLPPPPQPPAAPPAGRAPLSLDLPGGVRQPLTSYPNAQLTGDQYLENLEEVKPTGGKSVLQNAPPAQSFSMVTPEFVKKFEQTFADLPLEQRLAKLKTFTTPETPYAQRMAAQQILARVNKENQRTPSRDATSELAKLFAQSAPVKAERGGGADQTYKPVAFPEATPHFADNQTPAEVARQNELEQIISGEGNVLAKPYFKPATPDRNINDLLADTAISLGVQGPLGLAQGAVGLADLATFNLVGNGLQAMGLNFDLVQKTLDLYKSDSLQQAKQRVGDAKGFTNAVIASIVNPTATVDTLLQSAPAMLASIAAARLFAMQLLRNAGLSAGSAEAAAFLKQPSVISKLTLAGSATEGAQAAGSIQEKGRAAGRDYLQTAPSALGAGLVTAGLGVLTSKIPGLKDAEASAATAGLGAAQRTSLPAAAKEVGKATVKESLEEGSQSGSEQAFSNLSLGKPIGEGVPEAAGQGVVAGGAAGAGLRTFSSVANAIQANTNSPANVLAREIDRGSDAVDQFLRQFEASPAGVNPNLKNVGNLSPPDSAGRVEPSGKVNISTAPGRAEPAGEVDLSAFPGRTDPEMTADELAEIVAPKVDKKAEPTEGQPYSQPFISNRRIVVIRDVNGVQVPFYISTGSGGKKDVPTGQWYPYFGNGEDGWFNKGSEEDINDFYGSPELKAVADQLNSSVGDIRDQMDTLPAAADVRVNPSADMNPVSLSGARTPEGDRLWRSNIINTLDRIKKGAAKPTNQASDEEMVSLDEFAIPPIKQETITGVTPESAPEIVTPVTPEAPTVTPVTPASYAADLAAGKKKNTPADVEFYMNNGAEIEAELRKLAPKTETVTPVTPEAPAPAAAPEAPTVTPVTPPTKAAESLPETPTVPPASAPKLFEPPIAGHGAKDFPVVQVPVADLKLSEDVPQFKAGATAKGVVEPLGGTFTQEGVAPIAVWRRLDGTMEVISGRHRLDLAQRSNTTFINAQVYDEAQGFSAVDAATLDAELNIRDEQGKVKDYVNFFKASGTDRETAESKGLLGRVKGKRGFSIANQGSDALITALNGDQIGDEAAYYIALNAPNDERLQNVGLQSIMDGKSMNAAVNTMQAVKAMAAERDTTTDMFGFDDSLIKEAQEMAKIASKMQQSIAARLSAITGAAKNPAMAKAEGIDIRDPEAVKVRINELKAQKAALENWSTSPELVAEIRAARGVEAPQFELKSETPQETVARESTQDADRLAADQKKQADNAVDFFELESQTQGKPESPTEDMFAGEAGPSAEYQAADELAKRAGAAFRKVQEAYRKQEIGDDDFLAGRKVYDTAMAAYEKAFEKEMAGPTKTKAADKKPAPAYTPEQRAEAETHAKETGGTIVWQEGDYALIRGFSVLSGDPVYVPTIGSSRGRVDIGAFTGTQIPDDVKKKMLEVKQDLEEAAALKHKNEPFIVFDRGMAFSSDISEELAGVVRGWKDLLKLKPNLYISTVAAATENKDNFTGPHRRIGSATLDSNDRGSTRRMKDGSHYIVVTKSTSPTQMLEIIAHELGHIHEKEYFNQASPVEKEALKQAHATWVNSQKGKSAEELVASLRGRATARSMLIKAGTKADDLNPYWTSFGEWYADQTSRWAVTAKSPVTVVEKFFKKLALQLRLFYQRLHNAKYLPNETFVKYIEAATGSAVDLTPQDDRASKMSTGQGSFDFDGDASEMISSNNPVVAKGLNEVSQALPKAQKKLPPGRSPELAAAAQMVQDGTMTAKEYDALVNKYRPIPVYSAPLVPATTEQVFNALDSLKRQQVNPAIPEGTPVGLRLDIPSWNRSKTFVVSIHQQRPNNSSVGAVIGYASTAAIKNVTFALGNQKTTLKIATGQAKDAIQTMEGTYVPMTPAETTQRATEAFKSGDWVQVGIDPMRHSYFFDRRTTLPVIKADEVLQIGNMILAKGVTFGSKDNFLYNLDTTKSAPSTSDIRAVKIKEYAKLRARLNRVASTVAKGGVSIDVQRDTARLLGLTRELKEDIGYLAEPSTTPARFLSKALAEYDLGNISPEVLAVIQAAYNKTPWLLDGLRLSVRAAPGRGAAASFAPLSRIVSLYKETSGVEEPKSIRHELTHSLEQMMTVAQRGVVIDAWLKSMQLAIKNNPDQEHQTYFQAVMDHMENPTEKMRQAAIDVMPSYSMYQFINPSEFWAVNAESLMGQQLGAYWERFKKSMHTLLEGLKLVFGFDNKYAIHKTFNDIMNGSKARLTGSSLAEYVSQNQDSTTLLENKQDDEDLLKKHQQPHTPMLNTEPLRNFALKTAAFTKDMFKTLVTDPKSIPDLVMTKADQSLTFARNKIIWFGSGLNDADRIKYGGELRTAQDMATASLALDNALRGGSIGVQVLFEGGIKFDSASKNFVAVKTPKGMTNVYKAQAELKKKLGDQLGEDIIQSYLEAKRSRSIKNEEYDREQDYELLKDELKNLKADPTATPKEIAKLKLRVEEAAEDVKRIKVAASKVTMSDEAMDEFIALETKHPELRTIMDNWGALNQNLLKLWLSVGLLSKGRYDVLSGIKDYVPWQRIMNDEEDIHSPIQTTSRTLTNIGKEKLFKVGKPRNIIDFIAEAGQQTFKIQPSSIVQVEINGNPVAPTDLTFTPNGEVTINVPINEGDLVVFDTKREIENIIDNMTRNAMRMVMNGIRQYAALRIVKEYATRDEKNKIMVFPKVDEAKGRFSFIASGQRIVVEIKDPLIAEAIFGMDSMHLESLKLLAMAANFTRRAITLSGAFQIKQVFKDAPAAAFVTGVKNPAALLGGVYKGFVTSLLRTDPVVDILTQAGIGGFVSAARTPEADIKSRIGIINSNVFDKTLRALDHLGDASDMAQRVAIYKQVMADTGDAAQALYQANNVINFRRHGASAIAQFVTKTVPFANATAQSIDVLAQALAGGGLRGMKRQKALGRLLVAGTMLSTLTLLYCFAVGDDDDYEQMDDQTRLRNFMIPGTKILLPMNTGAAFFFKAIPELLYNTVMKQGTDTAMDMRRLKRALGEAARDMLLGPEPIPSAIRPFLEIGINHDFFTGRSVTPRGVEDLEKAEQYTASTSELAKMLGSKGLSPIEIDHLIRGLFGSAGAMAQWSSNVIGQANRPEMTAKDYPVVGPFVRSDALRGREDLFYDLADEVKTKYETWKSFMDRDQDEKADEYSDKNGDVVELMKYINKTEAELAKLNKEIKYYGETTDPGVTPKERREEIRDAQRDKNDLLEDIYEIRKDAGF